MDIEIIIDFIYSADGELFYRLSDVAISKPAVIRKIVGRDYYTGVCSYGGKVILSLAGIWLDATGVAAVAMLDTSLPPAVLKTVEVPFAQNFVTSVVHESMHSLMLGEAVPRDTHHWALEKLGYL